MANNEMDGDYFKSFIWTIASNGFDGYEAAEVRA